ncbi:MAG: F0F1 ATP synthase subunit B [Fimbriimonadaceae bacterium]|nr:F0F1 ATP synthase subunit B [Fimbriimonadaceae bacterium]
MANTNKSSAASTWIGIIVGAALAVGGFWVSKNWHPDFLDTLKHQGIDIDPGKTVSAIGVLLFLFPVVRTFYIVPLKEAIEGRTAELEKTFSEAEQLRVEMSTMKSEYENRIVETEAAAREQIQAEVKRAQDLATQLRAEASSQIEEMKRSATDEVARERDKAIRELQLHVVNLTLGATEKLLGENVDSEKNRKLVEEFIEKVEVSR